VAIQFGGWWQLTLKWSITLWIGSNYHFAENLVYVIPFLLLDNLLDFFQNFTLLLFIVQLVQKFGHPSVLFRHKSMPNGHIKYLINKNSFSLFQHVVAFDNITMGESRKRMEFMSLSQRRRRQRSSCRKWGKKKRQKAGFLPSHSLLYWGERCFLSADLNFLLASKHLLA
jgi:hypothetical protein